MLNNIITGRGLIVLALVGMTASSQAGPALEVWASTLL